MLVSRARRYMFVFVVCVRRTLRQGENHQSAKLSRSSLGLSAQAEMLGAERPREERLSLAGVKDRTVNKA